VFFQFYGQADALWSSAVMRKAGNDVNDSRRLASCGRPVPWVHVELLNPNNCRCQWGAGEIFVRGPLVWMDIETTPS